MSNINCNDWDSAYPEQLTCAKTGRPLGVLMPIASQETIEASPGIQSWSNPRGKVATRMYDDSSVLSFARQWERKYARSYPFAS